MKQKSIYWHKLYHLNKTKYNLTKINRQKKRRVRPKDRVLRLCSFVLDYGWSFRNIELQTEQNARGPKPMRGTLSLYAVVIRPTLGAYVLRPRKRGQVSEKDFCQDPRRSVLLQSIPGPLGEGVLLGKPGVLRNGAKIQKEEGQRVEEGLCEGGVSSVCEGRKRLSGEPAGEDRERYRGENGAGALCRVAV